MATINSLLAAVVYILIARIAMRHANGWWREAVFACLNLTGFYYCFCLGLHLHNSVAFVLYIGMVVVQYLMVWQLSQNPGRAAWWAFFTPLFFLILVRYVTPHAGWFMGPSGASISLVTAGIVGLSYQAFRCSRLVLEIRNGVVQRPNFLEYLNFAFFLPTMTVGPINTYANYRRGFTERYEVPAGRAALRILVGYVKFQLLGSFCVQLGYPSLLRDDHFHPWIDLPVAMFSYYLFLYCNFSGFCDMAIGAAALIGIPVPENFDNPFAARNVKDFWNRWHITLSIWMRDVVFSPLSKFFVGKFGIQMADHAIALTIVIVFLLVGIWHGAGWNFAAYGAVHALGVVTNHYYTIFLKKKLGREKFKAYNENRWIRAVAVVLTFCYCGASLIFFANTFPEIKQIFAVLR